MAERLRTLLMVVILIVVTVNATVAILGLAPRPDTRLPPVMLVRPGHAPVQWHGWQLIPPADSGSCERDGHDACSDGQGNNQGSNDQGDDDDPAGTAGDNEPTLI